MSPEDYGLMKRVLAQRHEVEQFLHGSRETPSPATPRGTDANVTITPIPTDFVGGNDNAGSGDNAANATIGFFSGRGFHDYHTAGNSIPNNATLTANTSPAGDILFSTKGFVAGDNYTIILEIR